MGDATVLIFNGDSLRIPIESPLNAVYAAVQARVKGSFGIFDSGGNFRLNSSEIPGEKKLFAYRGELAEVFFYINGKKTSQTSVKVFSREFGYPYHNRLLNYAAFERMIVKAIPDSLFYKKFSIEKITVENNIVDVMLSDSINEMSYRIVGALRLLNITPTVQNKYIKNLGIVKFSNSNAKLASQILSTWGSRQEFSELDKEIRNYKHFLIMKEEIPPKVLEGFFIDNSNEIQEKGELPDAFKLSGKSEYIDHRYFDRLKEMLLQKPELVKGKLEMYPTYFVWKSLSSKESYRFQLSPRIKELLKREEINDGDVAKMIVRYDSMGAGGQFTMTPRSVVDFLVKKFGIVYEGFGAPFNVDLPFCSLMYDVDIPFGSMGPFSWKQLLRRSGNWSINPPFTLKLLELALSSIIKACDHLPKEDETQFHILFPGWEDDPWMDILTGKTYSEYLVETIHMKLGEFSFERINGKPLYKPFGGLIYSVFSPAGKLHSNFGKKEILEIKEKFQETVPFSVRKNLENTEYISWRDLKAQKKTV